MCYLPFSLSHLSPLSTSSHLIHFSSFSSSLSYQSLTPPKTINLYKSNHLPQITSIYKKEKAQHLTVSELVTQKCQSQTDTILMPARHLWHKATTSPSSLSTHLGTHRHQQYTIDRSHYLPYPNRHSHHNQPRPTHSDQTYRPCSR